MRHIIIYIYAFVAFSLLQACSNQSKPVAVDGDTIRLKYSTLLTMVRYSDHTDVTIADPWHKGKTLQTLRIDNNKPYRKALIFTTLHCQLMEYLGCQAAVAGVCDLKYINIPDIKRRTSPTYKGTLPSIMDCGDGMAPNIERIIALNPDVMIMSPFENSGGIGKLQQLNIPVVMAADYMEQSPLGRAEWMKLYGMLFGCEQTADSLFNVVDSTYNSLKSMAIKMEKGRSIRFQPWLYPYLVLKTGFQGSFDLTEIGKCFLDLPLIPFHYLKCYFLKLEFHFPLPAAVIYILVQS